MNVFSNHLNSDDLEFYINWIWVILSSDSLFIFNWIGWITIHKKMSSFVTITTKFFIFCNNNLSDDVKFWFMGSQTQHDKIGICSIYTMWLIKRVLRRSTFLSDKIHYLMFPFPWAVRIWEHNNKIFPKFMILQPIFNKLS
jgi:hypothetical protein